MRELKNTMETPGIKRSHIRCSNIQEMQMYHLLGHQSGIKVGFKVVHLAGLFLFLFFSPRNISFHFEQEPQRPAFWVFKAGALLAYFHKLQGCSDLKRLQINERVPVSVRFNYRSQPALLMGIWRPHRDRESAVLLPVHILIRVFKSMKGGS